MSKINTKKAYEVVEIRQKFSRAYTLWSKEDDNSLYDKDRERKSIKELSEIFGRNIGAIISRLEELKTLATQIGSADDDFEQYTIERNLALFKVYDEVNVINKAGRIVYENDPAKLKSFESP